MRLAGNVSNLVHGLWSLVVALHDFDLALVNIDFYDVG